MGNIVLNAAGLFAMIFLGYFLKRLNVLSKADGSILSKIILNVTGSNHFEFSFNASTSQCA